jgi:RNA polymerase sigma-70 factor, ECF subfamily
MLKACSLRMANLTMGGAPRRATVLMGPPGSDRELFIALYADAYSRLVGQLYVFTGNRADAEEVVQQGFERAWLRWKRVRRMENPEGWVRRVSLNLAVSRWRHERHRETHGSTQSDFADSAESDIANRTSLSAALQKMRPDQRRAVVLFYVVGMKTDEIAKDMQVPLGTVKSWLSRARRSLGRELRDDELSN